MVVSISATLQQPIDFVFLRPKDSQTYTLHTHTILRSLLVFTIIVHYYTASTCPLNILMDVMLAQ